MKILVTGATGFVGNYVVNQLTDMGYEVIATSTSKLKAQNYTWFNKVTYIEHSIEDATENLYKKFNEPDCLIHLAWGHLTNFKSELHLNTELQIQTNFLTNIITNGLKDLTCVGTCLEYGMQEGELSEEMLCNPHIAYPMAKNQLRIELEKLQSKTQFVFKWMRLFYMYGNGQSPKSIIPLLQKAIDEKQETFNMSKGDQERDYLPIVKVSENIIKFALQQKITGIVNCCSGKPISIKNLIENYITQQKASIKLNLGFYPYADYEPFKFWGSVKKLEKITNNESNRAI